MSGIRRFIPLCRDVRVVVALAALAALLAAAAPAAGQTVPEPQPRVVVAVIDSAPNPYHEFFHAGGSLYGDSAPSSVTPDVLAEFGIDEDNIIRVTRTGDFAADFAKDKAQFDAIRRGEPYWFEGTNVIGISFNAADGARLRPETSTSAHGVGTSAAVLRANPEAIVVVVESPSGSLFEYGGFGTKPIGEEWAFNHPAVDMVSTSYGPPFSPPLGYHLNESYDGVVTNGKLHFGASDNSPALAPFDATAGPWWTVGVSGYSEGESVEERETSSGSLPDFVGDWTQTLPYCRACEKGESTVNGTSFATPRSAGTASKILLEARRAAGHLRGIDTSGDAPAMVRAGDVEITNWELRRALEEAAYYPGGDDAESWATVSWGAITPDPSKGVVTETLAHLGIAGTPTRTKSAEACQLMTANIEGRRAWWGASPGSDGFQSAEDPYIRC